MKKIIFYLSVSLFAKNLAAQNVGIGTAAPTDKLHINAATGTNPLKVDINNVSKLRVSSNGGTSIGAATTPPANGLLVSGSINPQSGISTNAKLVVQSTGDSIIMQAGNSQVILASNGNITIKSAPGAQININAGGNINLIGSASVTVSAATSLNLSSSASMLLSSPNITITAAGVLRLNGGIVQFNGGGRPIARQGDPVSVPGQPPGTITLGSPTILGN